MTRPEVTGRSAGNVDDDLDAFGIPEFCRRHGISPQTFYKMKAQGLAPAMFKLGARVLISREAATAWRREREAAEPATA
jgi:predicted DNA-binding transcriptional regulator AlpA